MSRTASCMRLLIVTRDTNPASLGDDLERQLRGSVPGFAEAVAEFGRSVPLPEREKLHALARKVLQPLANLVHKAEIRIVLDGFDRLPDLTRDAVREAVATLPENLRIVITARPDTSGCPSGHTLDHGMTPRDAPRPLSDKPPAPGLRASEPSSIEPEVTGSPLVFWQT